MEELALLPWSLGIILAPGLAPSPPNPQPHFNPCH
jgi:hypothetical protein